MRNSKLLVLGLLLSGILFVFSCTPDDTEDLMSKGSVVLEFDHLFDEVEFAINQPFTTATGETITPSKFLYYVTNVSLETASGEFYNVPNSYFLVDASKPETREIELADVPNNDYTKVNFTLGVDSTRNVSGAQEGALDPANGMFWSWNNGYIFVKLEGTYSAAKDPFRFHIGGFRWTANNLKNQSLTVPDNGVIKVLDTKPVVHFQVNVNEFFKNPTNLTIADGATVMSPNARAVQIANNYADMFVIDHVHN